MSAVRSRGSDRAGRRRDRGSESGPRWPASVPWPMPADSAAAEKAQHAVALAKKSLKAAEADHAAHRGQDRRRHRSLCVAASWRRGRAGPASPPASIGNAHLLQAEEALLKAEIADLEARNAAKQPGKARTSRRTRRDAAQEGARGGRGRSQVDERRCAGLPAADTGLSGHQHGPAARPRPLDHASR